MYHGIVLDAEFSDPTYPERFKIFAKKKSQTEGWILYGIELEDSQLQDGISNIQSNMKDGKYYAHLYNDKELVVIFKDRVFHVTPHISSWSEIIEYGRKLNIPEKQLDFWPNRFQDEKNYFNSKDFIT